MRKFYPLVRTLLVIIAVAAFVLPRAQDTTEQNTGPPNEGGVSLQADDMGLSFNPYSTTVTNVPTLALDEEAYSQPCAENDVTTPARPPAMIATYSTLLASGQEAEVSAPTRGTRAVLVESNMSEDHGVASSSRWGGLLRMVTSTGSRVVPVV